MTVSSVHRFSLAATIAAVFLSGAVGCPRDLPPDVEADPVAVMRLREVLDEAKSATAGATAVVADPTGFATIKGKVTLTGTPPTYPPPNVTSDQGVCGGSHVRAEQIITDGGGLKNVLIYINSEIPDDPKWIHESYNATKTAEIEFDQKKCVFLSHVLPFRSTQKLKIMNSDPVGHNTNIQGNQKIGAFNQIIPSNSNLLYDPKGIATPQPVGVGCTIHPWMTAYLFTRNHPYFVVTKDDGSFELPNVPAGVPLEIRVWHEAFRYPAKVTLAGAEVKTPKGTLKKTLTEDETWELALDASLLTK